MFVVIMTTARNRTTVKLSKHLDAAKLHPQDTLQSLQALIETQIVTWEEPNDQICYLGNLGLVSTKGRDWFDENDQLIEDILSNKDKIREHILQKGLPRKTKQHLERQFKEAKLNVKRRFRKMEDTWWSRLAAEIERVLQDRKNIKKLYNFIKQDFGLRSASVTPL